MFTNKLRSNGLRARLVSCCALDEARFRYTAYTGDEPVEPAAAAEARILGDFRIYFPALAGLTVRAQLLRLVGMNSNVKEWYAEWNRKNAIDTSAPEWLPSTKEDLAEWANLAPLLAQSKVREVAWTARIATASNALKEVVATVNTERRASIAALPPLAKISRVTVNELPLTDQLTLAVIADDTVRKARSVELVTAYQRTLYTQFRGGAFVDPFV